MKVDSNEDAEFLLGIYEDILDGVSNSLEKFETLFKQYPEYFYCIDGHEWHLREELWADDYFSIEVLINGAKKLVGPTVSFSEITRLAGLAGNPTIIYTRGLNNSSGVMNPTKDLKTVSGMEFTVAHTNNA